MVDEPRLYGRSIPDARRRAGSIRQLAGIDDFTETQGAGRGARRLVLRSGGGLTVELHPDRALDIGAASFRGTPIAWHSPVGFAAPALAVSSGREWLRSFGGGLLATCGLDSYGPASIDDGVDYPMHGRVGAVPAVITRTQVTDTALVVEGEVRQASVFGENLLLCRRITVPIGGSSIAIDDRVTNDGSAATGHMMLYHANLGWPLLDEGAVLTVPSTSMSPRDADAEQGLAHWFEISAPSAGYAEQVFKHDFADQGIAEVSLDNSANDIRVAIRFDTATLPALHQWKMLGEGDYVLGLEPTNVDWSRGRAAAREAGMLPMLEPGQSTDYRIEIHCGASRNGSSGEHGGVA